MSSHRNNLFKDMSIVALSILIAIILVKTGAVIDLLSFSENLKLLGSFIAGIFFTSVFTTVPAMVVLAEIAQVNSVILVSVFGGIGAMIGDLIIFRFVKNRLSEDISHLFKKSKSERFKSIFRLRFFKWSLLILGVLVIASPLPDELGLIMLGFSKMKTLLFIPVSFSLNFLGILVIGLIAKAII